MGWFRRKPRDPNACKISEETGGYFIGRKWCSTHEEYWDGKTWECPGRAKSATSTPPLAVGQLISFVHQGVTIEMVVQTITADFRSGAVRVELQDRQSVEEENRIPWQ